MGLLCVAVVVSVTGSVGLQRAAAESEVRQGTKLGCVGRRTPVDSESIALVPWTLG